jgi:predicted nuclease of predicted toxin-antitoxin system
MRYLTDENIPPSAVRQLRADGHDVLCASEAMAGQSDAELLAKATTENRVLVTFDKDF